MGSSNSRLPNYNPTETRENTFSGRAHTLVFSAHVRHGNVLPHFFSSFSCMDHQRARGVRVVVRKKKKLALPLCFFHQHVQPGQITAYIHCICTHTLYTCVCIVQVLNAPMPCLLARTRPAEEEACPKTRCNQIPTHVATKEVFLSQKKKTRLFTHAHWGAKEQSIYYTTRSCSGCVVKWLFDPIRATLVYLKYL